jgi:hypothetical protein
MGQLMSSTHKYFSRVKFTGVPLYKYLRSSPEELDFPTLITILDYLHISIGLLAAYNRDYPLVEPRELIPSFDASLIEYKNLPAFSMVVLDRVISYQDEGFQFDLLRDEKRPPDPSLVAFNRQKIRERLPRDQVSNMEASLGRKAITPLSRYPKVLPHLFKMDRGHVMARNSDGQFHLCGVFASFPSDLDQEIKRFGKQIRKFEPGNNELYAANRGFVYQFLMEQHGFPVCGERHTSAALFARRLMRRRDSFVVKVLGASDRTLTTFSPFKAAKRLPLVEKVALVEAGGCSDDNLRQLADKGFLVDPERNVVVLRVKYRQHAYHKENVLEERALSILSQEVVHPHTGETLELDILGMNQDRLLALNDIIRGEFEGSIIYERNEQVRGTRDLRSRMKFLTAWLDKHRHILADYSPDNFERIQKIVHSFFESPEMQDDFYRYESLVARVRKSLAELRVAHRLRLLENLVHHRADASGRKLQHVHVLIILVHFLAQEGSTLAENHPASLRKLLGLCNRQLDNAYVKRRYLTGEPGTPMEREVLGEHRLLSRLVERYEKQLHD